MLLFRERVDDGWMERIRAHLPEVLNDHAHLERKAASAALNMEKYPDLYGKVSELNAIAIEELQHFQRVLDHMAARGYAFGPSPTSPWISGLMRAVRKGREGQVIDHLICAALVEGRSCEKFQLLAEGLADLDPGLADFYASLVETEGNHYAGYLLMAREIDDAETDRRLDHFLDLDAELIRVPNPLPMLH